MKIRVIDALVIGGLLLCASALRAEQATLPAGAERILVGAGKTRLLDMAVDIERVSIAAPEIAEAVPVSARSLMVNGRAPGETSLVIWLSDGSRREYDVDVKIAPAKIQAAQKQIADEYGDSVHLVVENGAAYLTGHVHDLYGSDRAVMIADNVGKTVNLLKVDVPDAAPQILLKVRFADVDRSKERDLGINFFGVAQGIPFTATTGQFGGSTITTLPTPTNGNQTTFSLSDALNLFMFDPHLNIGDSIKALESASILEILAEPNVLAMNGKEASFVAGGQFPFPTLQGGGSGVGQITIQFQEYGVRLHFTPVVTPRGTIKLHVVPEVSSLDYSNSLSISGFTIPALATRRVETDVELQSGQSFAIAGLLNNQVTEALSKIPGLGDIPILGKLFTSKTITKQNSELLVIVTPELVAPIPAGQTPPDLPRPTPFLEGPGILNQPPRTPGTDQTGSATAQAKRSELSVQELQRIQREQQTNATPTGTGPLMAAPGIPAALANGITGGGDSLIFRRIFRRDQQVKMLPLTAALVIGNRVLWEQVHACIRNLPVRIALEEHEQTDPIEPDALLDRIERHRVDVVLLEASLVALPLEELVRRLRDTAAQPAVFIFHAEASPGLILEALRAGATEYLYPPLTDTLNTALERLSATRAQGVGGVSSGPGKIFGFLSVRGGCGATTFAMHVATDVARQLKRPSLLADFDFEAGLLRFLMKSKSTYSVRDALENLHRMDSSYWKALVSTHANQIDLIPAPEDLAAKQTPGPEQMAHLLRFIRSTYPLTIADFGRCVSHAALDSLPELDALYLVTTFDLTSLDHAKDAIATLDERGFGRNRLKVLLNRAPERDAPDPASIENFLGVPCAGIFTSDFMALYDAYSEGRLLDASTRLGKDLHALADSVRARAVGEPEVEKTAKKAHHAPDRGRRWFSLFQKAPA